MSDTLPYVSPETAIDNAVRCETRAQNLRLYDIKREGDVEAFLAMAAYWRALAQPSQKTLSL